jgi:uncharacterized protein YjdB
MRRNITLPAVLLIGLSLTCLTVAGQSKVNIIPGVGELRLESQQDARLKTEKQEARFKAEAQEARLKAEARMKENARNNGVANANRSNTAGAQLRSDSAEETYDTMVSYSEEGEKRDKRTNTYKNGTLIKSELFAWNGEDWDNASKTEYAYDDNRNRTLEAYYTGQDSTWLHYYKYEYKYEYIASKGWWTQTLSAYYTGKGEEWIPVEKREYTYEADGSYTSEDSYYKEGAPNYKLINAYDADENRIFYEYYNGDGDAWVESYKATYEFDEKICIAEKNYNWDGSGWRISWEQTYDNGTGQTIGRDILYATTFTTINYWYSEEGNTHKNISKGVGLNIPSNGYWYYSSNNYYLPWSLYSEEEIELKNVLTHDSNGNLTKVEVYSVTEENGEEVETPLYNFVIGYDDGNRMISIRSSDAEREAKYIREYDTTNGKIILEEQYYWDYDKNRLRNGNRYIWDYDESDRVILREDYYGDESGEGWLTSYKYTRTSDASGSTDTYYRGDDSGTGWVYYEKYENVDLAKGYQSTHSLWDTSSSQWILNEKNVTEYDDNWRIIVRESLRRTDGVLRGTKEEYEYNDEGSYLSEAYYLWDAEGDVWRGDYKIINDPRLVDAEGRPYGAIFYRWNINRWEVSGNTLYYPGEDETTPIELPETVFEVAAAFSYEYLFDLSTLLPDLPAFGQLIYALGEITNDDGIVDDIDHMEIEGSFLKISIKVAAPAETRSARLRADTPFDPKFASIPISIASENYGNFLATIKVMTSNKMRVTISSVTMDNAVYNGNPYAYAGTPVITEESEAHAAVTGLTLDVRYENETGVISETAPTNIGHYKLILSVANDNENYVGSASVKFTIEQRPIQVVAENKTIRTGDALPAFTYKVTGAVGDETAITGTPILSSPSANLSVAGVYTIEIDLKNVTPAGNYRFAAVAAVAGTLTVVSETTTTVSVDGVSLNASEAELAVGETFQLTATVSPSNADNKGVAWSTSDAAVATVAGGTVTAIAPGTATITVTTDEGGYTASCTVVVTSGSSVGTEQIAPERTVFFYQSTLTVDSPASETIAVYDFNGQLLFSGKKPQGKAVFTIDNQAGKQPVIVTGSSGWTEKTTR